MNKTLWIIIIAVIVIVGIWLWYPKSEESDLIIGEPSAEGLPELPEVSEEDTTDQIQLDLEQIDLGDIDELFEEVDTELNNL